MFTGEAVRQLYELAGRTRGEEHGVYLKSWMENVDRCRFDNGQP